MKHVATLAERLSMLLESDPRSSTRIAADIGISKQALSYYRNGDRSPKASTALRIANYYGVDVVWLMGYDVPQRPEPTPEKPPDYVPKTHEARTLAVGLDRLTPEQRERALKMVQLMFDQADIWEESDESKH